MANSYLPIPSLSDKDISRFYSKFKPLLPGGCWEWEGTKHKKGGRAVIAINGRPRIATRVAYFLFFGSDPGELQVQHTCNNPSCVCPLHLVLGTSKQNREYMLKCGRANMSRGEKHSKIMKLCAARGDSHGSKTKPGSGARGAAHGSKTKPESVCRGEKNGLSKLKSSDVIQIMDMNYSGMYSLVEIAEMFSVTQPIVSMIVCGKRWKHLYDSLEMSKRGHYPSCLELIRNGKTVDCLTSSKVMIALSLYSTGIYEQEDLALMFGMNQATISRIVNGKIWKRVYSYFHALFASNKH